VDRFDRFAKVALSLAIAVVALYLLLTRPEEGHAREAAMWLLGAIMGYWLK
jgi:hypothetical protein